ncbi:site-2 protease family protein [Halobacillus faecis]|nr:site-2 protease family protein [Halobacillus faecis]
MIVTLFLLIFMVAPLSLFIHELGHLFPGLYFRADQSVLHLGRGKVIGQWKRSRIKVYIHLFFFQGAYSMNERKPPFKDSEKAWISIGGPLFNAITAFVLFLWFKEQGGGLLRISFLFNTYLALMNLIPFSVKGKASDGYRLWSIVKRRFLNRLE